MKIEKHISTIIENITSANNEAALAHDLELFGLGLHNQTLDQAIAWATTAFCNAKTAVFVNVNSINQAMHNTELREHINQSDRVFADGSGVRLGARHLGVELKDNVNGTDLLTPMCAEAARLGRRIFLLGGAPGVAAKACSRLLAQHQYLQVAGVQHGFFDQYSEDNQKVIDEINASGTDILLVGLGSPIQERWIAENRHLLQVSTVLAVGGLFDFFSGRIARAPLWMRERGVEWLWRLLKEPKAKFKRYVFGNPLYMARLWFTPKSAHAIAVQAAAVQKHKGLSRFFQRAVALVALIALLPLLLLCALQVKRSSRGPVFYSQVRVGKHGKRFKFYKFRSMYLTDDPNYVDPSAIESDRQGICKKYVEDPRVTPIGRFMRKYSIDELPQLLNVVLGDMLIIGPRPALTQEVDSYQHAMYQRFDVMPGLTGLWQVSGRANTTFAEQIALDLRYVQQQSWWQDLRILASTVPAVLLARGAY